MIGITDGYGQQGYDIHGVLIVDKPSGLTSSSVVRRLKRWSKAEKVGHTGALDPMATGVLPHSVRRGGKI